MFSQTVEYALRAVVTLASEPNQCLRTVDISERTKVPVDYLFKVLRTLADEGLVKASRGVKGGFSLARDPEELSVLEIINAIDPLPRIRECPLKLREHKGELCALHRRMDQAMDGVEKALKAATIGDILSEKSQSKPLCEIKPRKGTPRKDEQAK